MKAYNNCICDLMIVRHNSIERKQYYNSQSSTTLKAYNDINRDVKVVVHDYDDDYN